MNTNITAEELLEYTEITFPKRDAGDDLFSHWILATAEDIAQQAGTASVELFGETRLEIAFPIFLRLRRSVREITYRLHKDTDATVIFSLYPKNEIVRPKGVVLPEYWKQEELEMFERAQGADMETIATISLDEWWDGCQVLENPLREFLRKLYMLSPAKDAVALQGKSVPLLPALLALNWFAGFAKEISVNGDTIKQTI